MEASSNILIPPVRTGDIISQKSLENNVMSKNMHQKQSTEAPTVVNAPTNINSTTNIAKKTSPRNSDSSLQNYQRARYSF
jgi:hypothetical protein